MPTPAEDPIFYERIIGLGGFCFLFSGPNPQSEIPFDYTTMAHDSVSEKEEQEEEEEEEEERCTILVPKGHYHWLLNLSGFSLLYSQSQF